MGCQTAARQMEGADLLSLEGIRRPDLAASSEAWGVSSREAISRLTTAITLALSLHPHLCVV